ncbi:MAG TPA: hypothetical protein VKB47_08625 [Terracidiphilus sp.]|nr:hypothetical protein [Terracidiphilus sp.]
MRARCAVCHDAGVVSIGDEVVACTSCNGLEHAARKTRCGFAADSKGSECVRDKDHKGGHLLRPSEGRA